MNIDLCRAYSERIWYADCLKSSFLLLFCSTCNWKNGIERLSVVLDGLNSATDAGIMFDLSQIGKVFGNNEYHPSGIIMQAGLCC